MKTKYNINKYRIDFFLDESDLEILSMCHIYTTYLYT